MSNIYTSKTILPYIIKLGTSAPLISWICDYSSILADRLLGSPPPPIRQNILSWEHYKCIHDPHHPWCVYTALIWQKEASDKSDISRKRAKCVCHLHWRQWNIKMFYLTYLLVGWLFLHEIWPGRRAHYVNYENINNSNLDGMSLASFCQSRAV